MVIRIIVISASLIMLVSSCTIKPPDVYITSDKTALEYQLFGEKARISDDPITTAAVWSMYMDIDEGERTAHDSLYSQDRFRKRNLILAQIRRRTMQGYIDEMKKSGLIGEGNNGTLMVMSDKISASNEIAKIVKAENNDRSVIWDFYADARSLESDEELSELRMNFARIMTKLSPTGTWIEDHEGNWSKK